MTDLDDQRVQHFRETLQKRKADLLDLEATGKEAAQTVQLDQTSVGRLSRMDALQGQAMSQEQQRRRMLELQRIESALARIDLGDYGYCLACDEVITLKRLEYDPSVTLCIDCAIKSEIL